MIRKTCTSSRGVCEQTLHQINERIYSRNPTSESLKNKQLDQETVEKNDDEVPTKNYKQLAQKAVEKKDDEVLKKNSEHRNKKLGKSRSPKTYIYKRQKRAGVRRQLAPDLLALGLASLEHSNMKTFG